jgi:hypothetical protein
MDISNLNILENNRFNKELICNLIYIAESTSNHPISLTIKKNIFK